MNDSVIAIRTADGALVPVLDKGTQNRKQLVVTTARNNQKRVHLDMYEGPADNLANSEYIGSLVIDQIDSAAAGETEIRFVAGLDERGQLKATATNLANGDSQSLSISLNEGERGPERGGDEDDLGDLPDFSMDDEVAEDLESLDSEDAADGSPGTPDDDLESLDSEDAADGSPGTPDDDLESLESEDAAGESLETPDDALESLESADAAGESLETPDDDLESLESAEASDAFGSGQESDSEGVSDLSEQFDEPPLFDDDFEFEDQPEESSFQDTGFEDDELEEIPLGSDEHDYSQPAEDTSKGFEIETQGEPETRDEIETGGGFEPGRESDFAREDFDLPEPETVEEAGPGESAGGEEDFALPEPDTSEDEGVYPTPSAAALSAGVPEDERLQDSAEDQGVPAASRPSTAFYIAYMLLALGILAGLIYLVYGAFQGEPVPPLESGRPLLASFFAALIARRRITYRSATRRATSARSATRRGSPKSGILNASRNT